MIEANGLLGLCLVFGKTSFLIWNSNTPFRLVLLALEICS
jgi:hypothetical protein